MLVLIQAYRQKEGLAWARRRCLCTLELKQCTEAGCSTESPPLAWCPCSSGLSALRHKALKNPPGLQMLLEFRKMMARGKLSGSLSTRRLM